MWGLSEPHEPTLDPPLCFALLEPHVSLRYVSVVFQGHLFSDFLLLTFLQIYFSLSECTT